MNHSLKRGLSILLSAGLFLACAGWAQTEAPESAVYWGTTTEGWSALKGSFSLDDKVYKSKGSSIRFEESGVYEFAVVLERLAKLTVLVRASGDKPVSVGPYVKDSNGANYDFPSFEFAGDKLGQWTYIDLDFSSLFLPEGSWDRNHRFDFPITSLGFTVEIPDGGKLNLDRIRPVPATGDDDSEIQTATSRAYWDKRLRESPVPDRRSIPALENPPRLDRTGSDLRVATGNYEVVVDAWSGKIETLKLDSPAGASTVISTVAPCEFTLWDGSVVTPENVANIEWDERRAFLNLTFKKTSGITAEVGYIFRDDRIEMDLEVVNKGYSPVRWADYPVELMIPIDSFDSVLWSRRGGVDLSTGFFRDGRMNRTSYPKECFANWTGISMKDRFLALGGLETASFLHPAELCIQGDPKTGTAIYRHSRPAYVPTGAGWVFPTFVMWINKDRWESIGAFREATGIASSPSLKDKLGEKFDRFSRTLMMVLDLRDFATTKSAGVFTLQEAGATLRRMPLPAFVNVESYFGNPPDDPKADLIRSRSDLLGLFPISPEIGGSTAFPAFLVDAREAGHLVAGEMNPKIWDPRPIGYGGGDPTIAMVPMTSKEAGDPISDEACPYHPKVKELYTELARIYKADRPVDLLFVNGLQLDPYLLDFGKPTIHPVACMAGEFDLVRAGTDILPTMIYGGFDYAAGTVVGLSGIESGDARDENEMYGVGNWKVFPLDAAMAHDKVAFYTYRPDTSEAPSRNLDLAGTFALGRSLSVAYSVDDLWLQIGQRFQEAIGPRIVGEPLTSFNYPTGEVTLTTFGKVTIFANHSQATDWSSDEETRIFAGGFYAFDEGERWRAGVFVKYNGREFDVPRYLVEERAPNRIVLRDLFPDGTSYRLARHRLWSKRAHIMGFVLTRSGSFPIQVESSEEYFEFEYPDLRDGKDNVLEMYFEAR